MEQFKWTDKLVLEFAQVVSEGSYGDYNNCKSKESKMNRFKEIKNGTYKS